MAGRGGPRQSDRFRADLELAGNGRAGQRRDRPRGLHPGAPALNACSLLIAGPTLANMRLRADLSCGSSPCSAMPRVAFSREDCIHLYRSGSVAQMISACWAVQVTGIQSVAVLG